MGHYFLERRYDQKGDKKNERKAKSINILHGNRKSKILKYFFFIIIFSSFHALIKSTL